MKRPRVGLWDVGNRVTVALALSEMDVPRVFAINAGIAFLNIEQLGGTAASSSHLSLRTAHGPPRAR